MEPAQNHRLKGTKRPGYDSAPLLTQRNGSPERIRGRMLTIQVERECSAPLSRSEKGLRNDEPLATFFRRQWQLGAKGVKPTGF